MDGTSTQTAATGGVARTHRALALFVLAGGVVQFFLAGWAAFGNFDVWDGHAGFGSLLTLAGLITLVLAVVGRRQALQASAVLFGLLVLQQLLGGVGRDVALVGAFHPVNGLLILGAAMLAAAGRPVGPGHHRRRPAAE